MRNRLKIYPKVWRVILLLLLTLGGRPLLAQDEWDAIGEIEDTEVIIEKERSIILPNARRIFERVPAVIRPSGILGLDYLFDPILFRPSPLGTRVRPLTIRVDPLPQVKNNNIKVGYGNYGTPFAELNLGNGRNDEYLYNFFLHHRSSQKGPIGDDLSGDSQSIFNFNGNVFLNKATLSGRLSYQREGFTFYGYDPFDDALIAIDYEPQEQILNQISLGGKIENNLPDSEAKYSLDAVFNYVGDRFSATEAEFAFNGSGRIPINDTYVVDIKSDFYLLNRKDSLIPSFNRYFLRIKPYLRYTQDNLVLNIGLSTVFENDTLGGAKDFHLFPFLNVNYDISSNTSAYLGYRGDMDKRSFKDNLKENRYLAPNVDVYNKSRTFDFYLGLKGTLGSGWNFDLGTDLTYYKNQGYFINSTMDSTKFDIIYDTGTGNSNHLYANFGYNLKNKIYLGIQENYYLYNTDLVAEAWHLPTNKLVVISSFTFGKKIKLNIDAYLLSGIKAQDPGTALAVDLDSIIDLNVGFEYLVSGQASVFVNTYNVLGKEYQRFLNYPNRGFQVLAGLSYSF